MQEFINGRRFDQRILHLDAAFHLFITTQGQAMKRPSTGRLPTALRKIKPITTNGLWYLLREPFLAPTLIAGGS